MGPVSTGRGAHPAGTVGGMPSSMNSQRSQPQNQSGARLYIHSVKGRPAGMYAGRYAGRYKGIVRTTSCPLGPGEMRVPVI